MHNIFLIAKREYLEKIRGRAFRLSTVLLPLLIFVLMGAGYLTGRNSEDVRHVAIACADTALTESIRKQLAENKDDKFTVDAVASTSQESRDQLMALLKQKGVDGFFWIEKSASGAVAATYTSRSSSYDSTPRILKQALNRALLQERLAATGMQPAQSDALLKEVPVESLHVNKEGKATKSTEMATLSKAMLIAFMLTMPVILYGMDMARSIIEEKSSRIFEVMLSVVRPDELLTGKLIGVGAVGLTQVVIWVAAAALVTGSALAAPLMSGQFSLHFSLAEGIFFPIYFVLGFFLYSSLFSGLAATCETAQELQMYTPLAVIPVWLSFFIIPFLMSNPSSIWAVLASVFPFTAPFVMIPRMGLEMPPIWEFAVSILLLLAAIWGVLWFSSRLYRVGILMYGKRATLPELMRWLKQA